MVSTSRSAQSIHGLFQIFCFSAHPDSSQSSANLANVLFEESLSRGDLCLPSALRKFHATMVQAIRYHSMIFQSVRRADCTDHINSH